MSQEDTSIQLMFRNVFHVDVVFPKAHVLKGVVEGKFRNSDTNYCYLVYAFPILFSVKFIEVVQYL